MPLPSAAPRKSKCSVIKKKKKLKKIAASKTRKILPPPLLRVLSTRQRGRLYAKKQVSVTSD